MGAFSVVMEVGDPTGERVVPFRGLVDTGSTLTSLPESLLNSLGVVPRHRAEFELADDSTVEYDVGNANIRYNGRTVANPVVFTPDERGPIIGAVTLETLGLVVDPVNGRLAEVNFLMK